MRNPPASYHLSPSTNHFFHVLRLSVSAVRSFKYVPRRRGERVSRIGSKSPVRAGMQRVQRRIGNAKRDGMGRWDEMKSLVVRVPLRRTNKIAGRRRGAEQVGGEE